MTKLEITMWVLFALNTLLLLISIFQNYKVIRLIKCTDTLMVQTTIYITLSLAFTEIYMIRYTLANHDIYIFEHEYSMYILLLFSDNFYLLAVVLTLGKW